MRSLLVVLLFATNAYGQVVDDTFRVTTQVIEVDPTGAQKPLANARGWLVGNKKKPGPHGTRSDTVGRWLSVSSSSGELRFDRAVRHKMTQYQIIVPFQGATYRSVEFAAGQPAPAQLRVYHVIPEPSDVSLKLHWSVDIGEVYLRVTQIVRVQNPTNTTMDYTHSPLGLRLPTLSNVIGEQVLTWGVFPPGKVHGNPTPSTGQGRLFSENGAIVYRGPVLPGTKLFFKVSYDIPYETEQVRLGALSDVPVADAAATVRWTTRVQPRIRLSTNHRAVRNSDTTLNRTDLLHLGGLQIGEPFIIEFDRLPAQSSFPMWIAASGAAVGILAFFLLIVAAVLRE
jgi:hypothetical protein